MRPVARIIAHVLATTAVVACGGKTVDIPDEGAGTPTPNPTTTTTTSPTTTSVPPTPTFPPTPPVPTTPPACTTAPRVLRGDGCTDLVYHACGTPAGVDVSDGLDSKECSLVCNTGTAKPNQYWGCSAYLQDDQPGPSFNCYTCIEGRRPEGYVEPIVDATVAGWLAHAADLERVSIDAFQILQRELAFHGAPAALVAEAARAEADEIRHARMMGNLAVREGASLAPVAVVHRAPRALLEIALENAVEGCIRETYGAVVAGYQAEHASRVDVRKLMTSIYRDETAHAELAWSVHEWLMGKLSRDERAQVELAMHEAIAELAASAAVPVPWEQQDRLGLPASDDARKLVRGLRVHLFMRELAA